MHALQIAHQGIEPIATGRIGIPIRRGGPLLSQLVADLHAVGSFLLRAYGREWSALP